MSEFFERPVLGGRIGNDLEPMLVYGDGGEEGRGGADGSDVGRRPDDPPAGASGTGHDPRRPFARAGPVGVAASGRPRCLRCAPGRRPWRGNSLWPSPGASRMRRRSASSTSCWPGRSPVRGRPAWSCSVGSVQVPMAAIHSRISCVRSWPIPSRPSRRRRSKRCGRSPTCGRIRPCAARSARPSATPTARVRVAAILTASEPNATFAESSLRRALDDAPPAARIGLLERLGAEPRLRRDLRLLGVVSGGLLSSDGGVREKAPPADPEARRSPGQRRRRGRLRELARDDSAGQRNREVARSLLASRGRSSGGGRDGRPARPGLLPRRRVLPIFNRMGDDGQNCMGCHRSHTILKMIPPGKNGDWPADAVRANYRSTLRVVNLAAAVGQPAPGQADLGGRRGGRGPERPDPEGPRRRRPLRGRLARVPDAARLDQRRTAGRRSGCPAMIHRSPRLNGFARSWEGEPPGEPRRIPARTEPRPPGITQGHLGPWTSGGERMLHDHFFARAGIREPSRSRSAFH